MVQYVCVCVCGHLVISCQHESKMEWRTLLIALAVSERDDFALHKHLYLCVDVLMVAKSLTSLNSTCVCKPFTTEQKFGMIQICFMFLNEVFKMLHAFTFTFYIYAFSRHFYT